MKRLDALLLALFSAALVVGTWWRLVPLDLTEVFGFVTGAVGVWLTVKENIWNWPVGLANNAFFVVLFFGARLYADMGLQVVYIALGILGWYWWLHGGERRERLAVSTTPWTTRVVLGVLVALCTWGLTLFLRRIGDSAPLWDALTTTLSLAAQYLLTRKLLENWWVWIAADVIYIALYVYKDLYLTSGLYAIFLCMCVAGLVRWRRTLFRAASAPPRPALAAR